MADSTVTVLFGSLLVGSLAGAVVCLVLGVLLLRGRHWVKGASALCMGAILLFLLVQPLLDFWFLLVVLLTLAPACFVCGTGYLCLKQWGRATVLFCTSGAVGVVLWAPLTLMARWPQHEGARALLMSSYGANVMALALCPIGAIYQLCKGRSLWGLLLVCLFAEALLFTAPGCLPFSWGPRPWRYWTATYYDRVIHENCYIGVRTEGTRYAVDRIRAGGPEAGGYAVDLRELVEHPQNLCSDTRRSLKQAAEDLRQITQSGSPEARTAAQQALGWLGDFVPELVNESPHGGRRVGRRTTMAMCALILISSIMAPLLCAAYAFLPLYVRQHRRRAVFVYTCAAAVVLVAVMLLICWQDADTGRLIYGILLYGSLTGAALCFICSTTLTLAKRYGWAVVFCLIGIGPVMLVGPLLLPSISTGGPKPWRWWLVVYWDVVHRDNCYACVLPEAIPYSVWRLRRGDAKAARWYGTMLREICEDPERIGPAERRALERAIVELREIHDDGAPAARAGAAEALRGIGGYLPELFTGLDGTSAVRDKR